MEDEDERKSAGGSRLSAYAGLCARVLAFLFGLFSLLNVVAALRYSVFDENIWWIDLRFVPHGVAQVFLAVAGGLLVAAAVRPPRAGVRKWATLGAMGVLCVGALFDSIDFYKLWSRHSIDPLIPIPLSLLIGLLLGLVAFVLWRKSDEPSVGRAKAIITVAIVTAVFVAGAPLAQMVFFGTTDYRRHADAIVVLGADVHPDGTPSLSLQDRMSTAIDLYQQGLAPVIIASGRG